MPIVQTFFVSQAVETLLENLELDKRSYRLGLSQVGRTENMKKIILCLRKGLDLVL